MSPDQISAIFRHRIVGAICISVAALSNCAKADGAETCAVPHQGKSGHSFYVDPSRGSMANDGSAQKPWSTLQDVFKHHLISAAVYPAPYKVGAKLTPADLAAPVHAGDTIYLRTGDHGDVALRGINDDFVTIAAEPGQKPVIDRLETQGASRWILKGLTFHNHGGWLVTLRDHNFYGPSDTIVFESNVLYSEVDVSGWSAADWRTLEASGINDGARCSVLRANRIFNVGVGIAMGAPHSIAENNLIDNFGDDGIDFASGEIAIIGNYIANNHKIGDGNHNDGIQGWTYNPEGEENVVIANNTLIDETTPDMPLRGAMQGISEFDGKWSNIEILNNYIRTDAWDGIALYGSRDSRIEGNTVVGDRTETTWIMITNMKKEQGGRAPDKDIVRRNVAVRFVLPQDGSVSASDNVLLGSGMMVPPG